jgi:hypothetical protein
MAGGGIPEVGGPLANATVDGRRPAGHAISNAPRSCPPSGANLGKT